MNHRTQNIGVGSFSRGAVFGKLTINTAGAFPGFITTVIYKVPPLPSSGPTQISRYGQQYFGCPALAGFHREHANEN